MQGNDESKCLNANEFTKAIIKCVDFAAKKHRDQRRLDSHQTPYINHPIGKFFFDYDPWSKGFFKRRDSSSAQERGIILYLFLCTLFRLSRFEKRPQVIVRVFIFCSKSFSFTSNM